MKLPDKIANAPVVQLGLQLYYEGFWELTADRHTGMGVGPIPGAAIRQYAKDFEFDMEQFDWLQYLVREMDKTYMQHHAKQKKGAGGKGKKWGPLKALGNLVKG